MPPSPQAMPIDHSGATGSLEVRASRLNATAPTSDAANVDSRRRRRHHRHRHTRPDQDRAEDRPATDAVDATDDSDAEGEHGHGPVAHRPVRRGRERPADQPHPDRQQDDCGDQPERARARDHMHPERSADHHARDRGHHEAPGQRARQASAARIAEQCPRSGDDVVEQVRRCDRGVRDVQHAQLDRQQEDRARDADRRSDGRDAECRQESDEHPVPLHSENRSAAPAGVGSRVR